MFFVLYFVCFYLFPFLDAKYCVSTRIMFFEDDTLVETQYFASKKLRNE